MEAGARRARAAVRSLGRRGLRQRIPETVRQEVLRDVDEARAQRRPWAEITAALGLSKSARTRWRRGTRRSSTPMLRSVRVVAPPRATAPERVVITRAGHRVEGLSLAEVLEVVRALA
jgi:hypothetical protein